jgi:hypothetical protein
MNEIPMVFEDNTSNPISDFLIQRHVEQFLNGIIPDNHLISDMVEQYMSSLKVGDHLQTPRLGYTHHGIYVGNKKVVHYSGLADGISSGPVEEISLSGFLAENSYEVVSHSDTKYPSEEIVKRAYSRINEQDYNLFFNNCEHFVYWCFYNINSSNQVKEFLVLGRTKPSINNIEIESVFKHIKAFINGDITKEKFFNEINNIGITTVSRMLYSGIGKIFIPIPIVGPIIEAGVGFIMSNILVKSGLEVLGDNTILKDTKERRKKIEEMCTQLIPIVEKNRKKLEGYIDKYFSDRKIIFEESFSAIELSLQTNNNELLVLSLEKIINQYGKSLRFKSIDDISQFRKSKKTLVF